MRIQKVITLLLLACLPLSGMAQKNNSRKKPTPTVTTTKKTTTKKTTTKKTTTTTTKKTTPTAKVKVSDPTGYISGHGYVDLGLPSGLKWATCNVGASSPSDYGNYYAWGETSTKSEYSSGTSKTSGETLADISGASTYDAARVNWGGSWRLPTKAEFDELLNRCTWTWTSQNGHKGYLVKGPNGRSIFIPAAGYRYGTSLNLAGEIGYYWSSTPDESNSNTAYYLLFGSGDHDTLWSGRYYGFSVRGVSE